jgi:hypothetical protein
MPVGLLPDAVFEEDIAVQQVGLLHVPGERTRGREEGLNGFQGPIGGFGVKEEDDWDPKKIQTEEKEVCAVLGI